ncbi:MAG TPA: hypothetical protein VGS19_12195 [Streptosporangiaceae bacterium]|nr:hypothetical protein [Streptosporangiaceae bacterium]
MRRAWLVRVAMAAVPVMVIAGVSTAASASAHKATAHKSTTISTEVTLYGWDDNSPPGCATAYSGCARSGGTFAKPTTFATDKAELAVGTIVYYAPLKRYFVMGDDCVACDNDWTSSHKRHIDLWAGGFSGDNANALFACEDHWTVGSGAQVIVNPPSGMPVANNGLGGPIFRKNNTCWHPG